MEGLFIKFFFWIICAIIQILLSTVNSGSSWCPVPPKRSPEAEFKQKTNRFWEFEEHNNRWVLISLPFDLVSCTNDSCTKVGTIKSMEKKHNHSSTLQQREHNGIIYDDKVVEEKYEQVLPLRKRSSLTKMSEASVWVTGQSGSIFERFWNGVQWVIAPHDLPASAGQAISVFFINQTILALSEAGMLYQLQLNENSHPIWRELVIKYEESMQATERELNQSLWIKSGDVSSDGERVYLITNKGFLLEISHVQPLRWDNFGQPPGGDVSAIADTGNIRPGVVFTISSSGDLYEFDKKSKPSWKKHIWSETSTEGILLKPSAGCTLKGLVGAHSLSLFLLTKDGFLIERRLHKRKWKWTVHGAPQNQRLSAITPAQQNESNEKSLSLFFTTSAGTVYEYQLHRQSGATQENQIEGLWVNHMHPLHAKVARSIRGVQLQTGRILFPLDDGRLGELCFPGISGEGPSQISLRRKTSNKYEWSVIDVPETEGWNAEYCTDEHGSSNCIAGIKDVLADEPIDSSITIPSRKRRAHEQEYYLSFDNRESGASETNNFLTKSINTHFRMRVMHEDRSFFLITDSGITFEYLYTDNVWLWLRHEHSTSMKGAVGSYNGSLFLVDAHGSLLIRERSGNELSWTNCTAMRKGKQVATGSPWDAIPSKTRRVTAEDAIYFVNKKGRLLQFTVALRKFKWKDCHSPVDARIAYIVDQEVFRMNIIFVVGRNGRLYQYNRVTELWHEHYQSHHLVLSRSPGTAMRPSLSSLTGSLFMISENGALVEYHWNSLDGWEWVEHGTPYKDVVLVGAPGPCFDGTQLFVIGSDGNVYRRHLDPRTWKWTNHGYPHVVYGDSEARLKTRDDIICTSDDALRNYEKDIHYLNSFLKNCDEKVGSARPIPFSEDSVIFELRDGRLAELRRSEQAVEWEWTRIIGTPTSPCLTSYWTAVAS